VVALAGSAPVGSRVKYIFVPERVSYASPSIELFVNAARRRVMSAPRAVKELR
jgi:hypothetical protein